ncbi:hypothetical protein HHK36_023293 [Tetracentron sinense]|uniref:Glycolipid transfer protein domain-containing protein n=1 Tax=Tetracentron sinense TaxID=13715 RepID=A0A835D540_TETSI|nr:hypothetical protein HHK36_023293 [Tetracentron sinense]
MRANEVAMIIAHDQRAVQIHPTKRKVSLYYQVDVTWCDPLCLTAQNLEPPVELLKLALEEQLRREVARTGVQLKSYREQKMRSPGKRNTGITKGNFLKDPASMAYAREFFPHHGWVIRKAVATGMYALPTKAQLLKKLNEDGSVVVFEGGGGGGGGEFLGSNANGPSSPRGGCHGYVLSGRAGSTGVEGKGLGFGPRALVGEALASKVGLASESDETYKGVEAVVSDVEALYYQEAREGLEPCRLGLGLGLERKAAHDQLSQGKESRRVTWAIRGMGAKTRGSRILRLWEARGGSGVGGGRSSISFLKEREEGNGTVPKSDRLTGRFWEVGSENSEIEQYTPLVFSEIELALGKGVLVVKGPKIDGDCSGGVGEALWSQLTQPLSILSLAGQAAAARGGGDSWILEVSVSAGAGSLPVLISSPGATGESLVASFSALPEVQEVRTTTAVAPRPEVVSPDQVCRSGGQQEGIQQSLLPQMSQAEISKWVVAHLEIIGSALGVSTTGHESAARSLYHRIEGGSEGGKGGSKDNQKSR